MKIDRTIVASAEAKLIQAMLDSDVDALDQLLDERLIFTNHLGMVMHKSDDLGAHRQGIVKIYAIDSSEQQIEIFDASAVVSVKLHIHGSFQGQASEANFRFTRIWQLNAKYEVKLVAGHSSLIAAE